jgi:hypothetical protein
MKMNLYRAAFVALLTLANGVSVVPARAADDEASSLEELKRAMTEPSEAPKKKRTRAIVFDGDASQAPASAPAASSGPWTVRRCHRMYELQRCSFRSSFVRVAR